MEQFLDLIEKVESLEELANLKVVLFGKSGHVSSALREIGKLEPSQRKQAAEKLNVLKEMLLKALDLRKCFLESQRWQAHLQSEYLDVTIPSFPVPQGRFHPLMQTMEEVITIFSTWGFSMRKGPDIETEFYNFDALNIPLDHPARAMQDTFYLDNGMLLRTHTSNVQIRTMMTEEPPLRILSVGRVYRADHDRTHTPMFHQVEGLLVDQNITMGHMKWCVENFLSRFFDRTVCLRFRPSFFPFTEPSAEVDIAYHRLGERLIVGEGDDWLEVLGCGMVHPHVFEKCGWNHTNAFQGNRPQGFAFGMGIERLAMLKYGISDIRLFYINDQRWLDHYGGTCVESLL